MAPLDTSSTAASKGAIAPHALQPSNSERVALDSLAATYGFHVRHTEERSFYSLSEAWPLYIVAEYNAEGECVLHGTVRCRGQAGCRTDLNDWISALWAINLRMWRICSPFLIDEESFVSSAELAARHLLFTQSEVDTYRPGENDGAVVMLFMFTRRACELIGDLWQAAGIYTSDTFDYGLKRLPSSLAKAFTPEKKMDVGGLRSGVIGYYRRFADNLSFTDLSACKAWSEVREAVGGLAPTVGESLTAFLLRTEEIRNAIPRSDKRKIDRALRRLGLNEKDAVTFPCESHLLCVTDTGILALRSDSGADRYAKEFIALQQLTIQNNAFLGQDASFSWCSTVDPVRFEELVQSLLQADSLVRRVKQVGHANEPDGGRDCIAEVSPAFLRRPSNDSQPEQTMRIIVQCKAFAKNVGKSSVTDIRDTVDQHNAEGFLLVAFPGVTRPLTDYVESIRQRNLFWIDVWTKSDVEARMRANLSCARRFDDLVTVDSGSSRQSI